MTYPYKYQRGDIVAEEKKGIETKYEWCVEGIKISEVYKDMCNEEDSKEFAYFCFINDITFKSWIGKETDLCIKLLEEMQKPGKEHWLKYAIENEYIKKIPTYKTVWVNLYYFLMHGCVSTRSVNFDTKEEALKNIEDVKHYKYLETISIQVPEE